MHRCCTHLTPLAWRPFPALQLPPSSPRSPKRAQEDWLEGIEHPGLRKVLEAVKERDPQQPEFLAAVKEVAASIQVSSHLALPAAFSPLMPHRLHRRTQCSVGASDSPWADPIM